MRVFVVYGSESGTAEGNIRKITKAWKASTPGVDFEICEGSAVARMGLATLKDAADFLVVATSSNGEGDPPYNFHAFLSALYAAKDAGGEPLAGLRHAVLGFGCSHFDTYQNCPRLTDKLLGELGSKRAAMRAEIDDVDEDAGDAAKAKWSAATLKAITAAAPIMAPVCAWSEPKDTILDKHDEMLVAAAAAGNGLLPIFIGAALAVAGVGVFLKTQTDILSSA